MPVNWKKQHTGSRPSVINVRLLVSLAFALVCLTSVSLAQEQDRFHLTYTSQVEPLPLNRIHSWIVHVQSADGVPVERASIKVDGGMPAHNHGLPTRPVASELGKGDYLVEGIKFSMTGRWEIWFEISSAGIIERKKVELDL